MTRPSQFTLSSDEVEKIEARVVEHAKAERPDAAWEELQKLLRAQRNQEDIAVSVVRIVEGSHLPIEKALEALSDIHRAHPGSDSVLAMLGGALEQARDVDLLNAPPPDHPLFATVTSALAERAAKARGSEAEEWLLRGAYTAARIMARQRDDVAEASARRLIEIAPDNSSHHYNLGLFLKTRGRFREGVVANQAARERANEIHEACEWNLGICATGAGEGALALEVWKRMNQRIEMGRFGLPEGRYPHCKVQLAQRPLAERTSDADDPGLEESIWIDRLSPCHGIIRSVLFQDLGIDYGDVILFDGAPITHHTYGEEKFPVFPHLATLVRNRYQMFDFAGTQEEAGQIGDASKDLDRDAVVYSHSENYVLLCAACWRDPEVDHQHEGTAEERIVTGRIAAPRDFDVRELLQQLDAAIAKRAPCRLYVPDLCEAAGFAERAAFERRRFDMIT